MVLIALDKVSLALLLRREDNAGRTKGLEEGSNVTEVRAVEATLGNRANAAEV